jgi:hypothetical protein
MVLPGGSGRTSASRLRPPGPWGVRFSSRDDPGARARPGAWPRAAPCGAADAPPAPATPSPSGDAACSSVVAFVSLGDTFATDGSEGGAGSSAAAKFGLLHGHRRLAADVSAQAAVLAGPEQDPDLALAVEAIHEATSVEVLYSAESPLQTQAVESRIKSSGGPRGFDRPVGTAFITIERRDRRRRVAGGDRRPRARRALARRRPGGLRGRVARAGRRDLPLRDHGASLPHRVQRVREVGAGRRGARDARSALRAGSG